MRIAFIAEQKRGANKNTREIALAMKKAGSEVFFYETKGEKSEIFWATMKAFSKGCDVIHYEQEKMKCADSLAKLLWPKTIIVSISDMQCPFVPKSTDFVKKSIIKYSISKLGLRSKKYMLAEVDLLKSEGIHFLIDAFKQLENTAKTPNNFKLVIIAHEQKDDEYERYLRHICNGRPNVVLLYDEPKEMLELLYANAYLYVQTSELAEATSRIRKAMELGLAVLANETKENVEILSGSGRTFSLKKTTDLRDKLAYLLSRKEEVERIGKLLRKKLEKEYSVEKIASKSVESYKLMYLNK